MSKDVTEFEELSVERLNIVDRNGVLRMAISGKDRFPNPIIDGREFVTNRRCAGFIFFNDDGDECGGLTFGNKHAEILFDQYHQDQIVGIVYSERDGKRRYGLTVWDRPDTHIRELVAGLEKVRAMPEGPERTNAEKELRARFPSPLRLFAGRQPDGSVAVVMFDGKGNERVKVSVGADDVPRLQVLGENGEVKYSLSPKGGEGSPAAETDPRGGWGR